jgi:isopropylmalate/homocitrate/citramalate synthase
MALEVLYRKRTGIRTERILRLSELVEKYSGVPIPVHKPIVGTNSFTHEAGVHVAAVLRNPLTYEPFPPKRAGRTRRFSLGKHSGTRLVEQELRRGGFRVTRSQARELIAKLKSLKEGRSKRKLSELVKLKRALDQERSQVSEGDFLRLLTISNRHNLRS